MWLVSVAERVHPSVSVLMDSSRAKHKAEEGAEAFEVVEKINNSGFVKVFKVCQERPFEANKRGEGGRH